MDLRLSDEQRFIRDAARAMLSGECPPSFLRRMETHDRGLDPSHWQRMAALGWQGVALPEEHGGTGLTLVELCLILEQQGRHRVIDPLATTAAVAGYTIEHCASDAQRQHWLPSLAAGDTVVAASTCVEPPTLHYSSRGDTLQLGGRVDFVPFATAADAVLLSAGGIGGPRVLWLDPTAPGIHWEHTPAVGAQHLYSGHFDTVTVEPDQVIADTGTVPAADLMLQVGATAAAAELLGIADRVLELTVEYAKERRQFGRPIGSFQAVQHHCANMAMAVLSTRHTIYEAPWRLAQGLDAREAVAIAKTAAGDSAEHVCALGHQVHGAIGFTREHDLQLYSRRAQFLAQAFGDALHHIGALEGLLLRTCRGTGRAQPP